MLSAVIWLLAQNIDRQNIQTLVADLRSANNEVIRDIERSFWDIKLANSQNDADNEIIFGNNINLEELTLFNIDNSSLFGTNVLLLHNNRFYAMALFKTSTHEFEYWYPIARTINLYNALTEKRVAIKTDNEKPPHSQPLTLARAKNLAGDKTVLIAVEGIKSYSWVLIVLPLLLLIVVTALIYSIAKRPYYRITATQPSGKTAINDASEVLARINIKSALNNSNVALRFIDTGFSVIFQNREYEKLTSVTLNKPTHPLCHESFGSIYCHTDECPVQRIVNGADEVKREETRFLPTGKKILVELHAYPLKDDSGKTIAIAEEIKDITGVHYTEEILRQTENQFTVFIDSLPFGVFIEDGLTHEIVYQNFYLKQLTSNTGFKEFIKGAEIIGVDADNNVTEFQLMDSAGIIRYFNLHQFKFLGVNNRLKIGGLFVDNTRKKEIEHYRDVLSKAIEFTPVSIAILSPYFEFEFINPNFTEITGLTIENLFSKSISDLGLEYDGGKHIQKALDSVRAGKTWQGELQLNGKNKERIWVSASFTPVMFESKLQHILVILENITRRKEYEKELILAKNKAEESDRIKTTFLNNISHEIRTPLNAIIGFSSVLTDPHLGQFELSGFSDLIYKNSQELLQIIENLLEISQIEAGEIKISKTEFSINALMNEIYSDFEEQERGGSRIKLSLRKEIFQDDLVVLSDPARIKQVLKHLLSNSFKFTPNGFVEFGYRLKDENNLLFYVVDSGIGIEPDKMDLIFNPFRQADSSCTRRHGGLGLGLAISKHVVEKLGGKIWINSTPGSGTSVFFSIPLIPVKLKFENVNTGNGLKEFNWDGKTILIADDIDANFVFFKAALQKTKANLIWARNGHEALNYVRKGQPVNLILMDLVMPEMDGFEATRIIKSINQKLPVVGQTAYPETISSKKLAECGFDTVLKKPIHTHQMLMEIDRFLVN
ncbi:MAG TPA: response regulator [Bacteroidales bacterium]|nr:response regulator [Bacteroidales bacterium]